MTTHIFKDFARNYRLEDEFVSGRFLEYLALDLDNDLQLHVARRRILHLVAQHKVDI